MHFDQDIPFGAYLDRFRWTYKVQEQLDPKTSIQGIYADANVLIVHRHGYTQMQSLDQGHSALNGLAEIVPYDNIFYRNCSMEAVEYLELNSTVSVIAPISVAGQTHYAFFDKNQIHLVMKMRPLDILFTIIKVTHESLVCKPNPDWPLEKFISAYGILETATLVLQIWNNPILYINVRYEQQV